MYVAYFYLGCPVILVLAQFFSLLLAEVFSSRLSREIMDHQALARRIFRGENKMSERKIVRRSGIQERKEILTGSPFLLPKTAMAIQ